MPAAPISPRDAALHVGLFAATCATTTWYGGPAFAATLMGILLCHELGHYLVGRRRGVDASLPYFIPLPPQVSFGTLGAVIRMRDTIEERGALFDVGAAGPIAGLAVAIPLLVVGLAQSSVGPVGPDSMIEGNSLLYAALKFAVFHRWLPGDGVDVQLGPVANAAWIGLLLTMVNLLPVGQLDGGHVARAVLGERHERLSAWLHRALPIIGLVVGAVMLALARGAGHAWPWALRYASHGVLPWVMWAVLLGLMRRGADAYHPPVADAPLDPARRRRAVAVAVIYALIFTPVPFRPPL